MINDSLSLGAATWELNIGLALEQAKSDANCTIIRTSSNRKQREVKSNMMTVATLVATIAFGILAKVVSPFFALPAIGFAIWTAVLRNRAFKVISFTEQENQERSAVWRRIELLSDLALWTKGRASPNDDSEHRNFSQYVTPEFNRFLNRIFAKIQNSSIQMFYETTSLSSLPSDVSLSLSQLMEIYSIFRDVVIYRHLENQPTHERAAANILAKSMDCSREQILARLPQIPNITDVYERMAQQIRIAQQIAPNEVDRSSLAKVCRELPLIPLLFSRADRLELRVL